MVSLGGLQYQKEDKENNDGSDGGGLAPLSPFPPFHIAGIVDRQPEGAVRFVSIFHMS